MAEIMNIPFYQECALLIAVVLVYCFFYHCFCLIEANKAKKSNPIWQIRNASRKLDKLHSREMPQRNSD